MMTAETEILRGVLDQWKSALDVTVRRTGDYAVAPAIGSIRIRRAAR
jgi:hypothetical protein